MSNGSKRIGKSARIRPQEKRNDLADTLEAFGRAVRGPPLTDEEIDKRVEQSRARLLKDIKSGYAPSEFADSYMIVERGPGSLLTITTRLLRPSSVAQPRSKLKAATQG